MEFLNRVHQDRMVYQARKENLATMLLYPLTYLKDCQARKVTEGFQEVQGQLEDLVYLGSLDYQDQLDFKDPKETQDLKESKAGQAWMAHQALQELLGLQEDHSKEILVQQVPEEKGGTVEILERRDREEDQETAQNFGH